MRIALLAGGVAAGLLAIAGTPAEARHRHHTAQVVSRDIPPSQISPSQISPSEDAIELAGIAPPTRSSTVEQTYGDAAFARARAQSRYSREEDADSREAASVGVPYPCDPQVATADAYVCRNDPRVRGYGQYYAFTPSYVSSPHVFMQDPSVQSPVMPAITGLFWAVNSARVDPR